MNIGSIWNGWKIEQLLGKGSYGSVYKIVRSELDYTYYAALKVIKIPQSDSEFKTVKNQIRDENAVKNYFRGMVKDLASELSIMSKVKGNSNIVSYEDHIIEENKDSFGWTIYIRMELLTPLYDYIESHNMSVREVIKLGLDMCKALEVCQKYNIIHRDIKPENIFVSDIGEFKLGDFGIARQLEKASHELSRKGTYTYMAPEVYKGLDYGSNVDIYSLGIVLYSFLNDNRAPFMPQYPAEIKYVDKEKANILRMSGNEIPLPRHIKGRLAEIVMKACAYNPSDRYDSPNELKNALESVYYDESEASLIYPDGDILKGSKNTMRNIATLVPNEPHVTVKTINLFDTNDFDKEYELEEPSQSVNKTDEKEPEVKTDVEKTEPKTPKPIEVENTNSTKTKKIPKKIVAVLSALLAAILVMIVGVVVFMSNKTTVPEIAGLSQSKANKLIETSELEIGKVSKAYSETVKKDCVISLTDCKSGETVDKGTEISYVLSKGSSYVKVPDVVNLSESDADEKLKNASLKSEVKYSYSDKVKKNKVISQSINQGTKVKRESVVEIVVSKGAELVKVPNVVGKSESAGTKILKDNNLNVKVITSYSSLVEKDKIIEQTDRNKKVKKNTLITIVVSLGPKPTEPPINYPVTPAPATKPPVRGKTAQEIIDSL